MPAVVSMKVAKTTIATVLALCMIALSTMASGSFGSWTDTSTINQGQLTMGTLTISASNASGGGTPLTTQVSAFAAGDSAIRYFGVQTAAGSLTPTSLTLGATFGTFSDTSTEGGTTTLAAMTGAIRFNLEQCVDPSTPWAPAAASTCTGGTWTSLRTGVLDNIGGALTQIPAATQLRGYRITYNFCGGNDIPVGSGCTAVLPAAIMGGTFQASYTVTAQV